jgi:GNAT superfamily N-acetyltransferase
VSIELVDLDRRAFAARADEVLDVYAEAMEVPRQAASGRRSILATHLERDALTAVGAVADDGTLVGIAYGYRGAAGQWWHDQVRAALDEDSARRWLDGSFEVCEFHVRPAHQGTGLGRAMLARLLARTDARTAVLTTPDLDTRARRFYAAAGWVDLVRDLRFPGDPRSFAVLALPLASDA